MQRFPLRKIVLAVSAFCVLLMGTVVSAASSGNIMGGLNETKYAAEQGTGLTFKSDVPTIVGDVIGTALSMISVLFFILMLYGGITWMLARGNEDQAKKALDTIIAAIIGIIVVLGSYALTSFVFKSASGQAGAPTSAGSQCETYYGSAGLSCNYLSQCDTNSGFISAVHGNVGQGDLNTSGIPHIANLCPGAVDFVCCKAK